MYYVLYNELHKDVYDFHSNMIQSIHQFIVCLLFITSPSDEPSL